MYVHTIQYSANTIPTHTFNKHTILLLLEETKKAEHYLCNHWQQNEVYIGTESTSLLSCM